MNRLLNFIFGYKYYLNICNNLRADFIVSTPFITRRQANAHCASLADNRSVLFIRTIALWHVGEETTRPPQTLAKQDEGLARELEYCFKQLGSMLKPMLILLVAVILISMYLLMFRLGGVVG